MQTKTIEEMHDMDLKDLRDYKRAQFNHYMEIDAIITYIDRIGHPKLLEAPIEEEAPEEADFEEE